MEDARTYLNGKTLWRFLPFVLCLLLYAPVVSHVPFYYDDYPHFVENQNIVHPKTLHDVFYNGFQETRPLYNVSLAIQAKAFGTSVVAGHWINLGLFLLAGYLLGQVLLALGSATLVVNMSTLIFLLHPIAIETVVYMNSRSGLLAAVFSLAAFLCVRRKIIFAIFFLLLAMLSKEDATGSVLICLWILSYQNEITLKKSMALLVSLGLMPLLFMAFHSPHHESVGRSVDTWYHYLFFQGLNLPLHLSVFVYPVPLAFNRDLPSSWLQPSVWITGWIFLATLAWLTWKNRKSALGFCLGWAVLSLLPTHSIIPLLDVQATRIYFPALAAMSTALVIVGYELSIKSKNLSKGFAVCLAAFLACLTFQELRLWKSPILLWEKNVAVAPSRWRLWLNLAVEYAEQKRWTQAKEKIEEAYRLAPKEESVVYNRAAIYYSDFAQEEKISENHQALLQLIKEHPAHAKAKHLLELYKAKFKL